MNGLCRLTGIALLTALFATPAAACGGAVMLALLFTAYPQAEAVVEAEALESKSGLLSGPRWTAKTGLPLHTWRAEKTAETVAAIENRLDDLPVRPPVGGSAHILLIHEFRWLELASRPGGTSANLRGLRAEGAGPRFFTTRHVLDNLLAGTLAWDDALGRGLIQSTAPLEEQAPWLGILHAALVRAPQS